MGDTFNDKHPRGKGGKFATKQQSDPDPSTVLTDTAEPTVDDLRDTCQAATDTYQAVTARDYANDVLAEHPNAKTVEFDINWESEGYNLRRINLADGTTIEASLDDSFTDDHYWLDIDPANRSYPGTIAHEHGPNGETFAVLHVHAARTNNDCPAGTTQDDAYNALRAADTALREATVRDYARTILDEIPDAVSAEFDIKWDDGGYNLRNITSSDGTTREDDEDGGSVVADNYWLDIDPDSSSPRLLHHDDWGQTATLDLRDASTGNTTEPDRSPHL